MTPAAERRLLQVAIAIGGLVPVGAGAGGVFLALDFVQAAGDASAANHMRYLSGLLLGIGLVFWASIPAIERHGARVRVLTLIVFIGGLARLGSALAEGMPDGPMTFGLVMELAVTPALCLWQARVARRCGT